MTTEGNTVSDSEVNEIIQNASQMVETMKEQGMTMEDFSKALLLEIDQIGEEKQHDR